MNELDLSSISDWELDLLIEIKKWGKKKMVSTTEVWNQFKGKFIIVTKRVNEKDYFYRGLL